MSNTNKAEKLLDTIVPSMKAIIKGLEQQDRLDHFEISISNHNGTIQVDQIQKDRLKAY